MHTFRKIQVKPRLSTEHKKGERFTLSGISTRKVNFKHFIVKVTYDLVGARILLLDN